MYRSTTANIYYLYLIKLSKWLMLIMPIVALFFAENGLDPFAIYLLQGVYSLSLALFEIPSGYLADVIGRRTSLIIGSLLGTLGFVVLSFSHSLPGFLLAEIILGLGGSFISGSDSALLYDSLAAEQKQHYYLRYEGRITALGNLAETVAAIGGGLLAAWLGYRSVYMAQTVIAALAIPAALLIVEPPREQTVLQISLRQIVQISRQALLVDRRLSSVIIFSAVAGIATLSMAWTAQIYFLEAGFSEREITPLWVALNLVVAVISAVAAPVVTLLGMRRALLLTAVGLPLGYLLLGLLPLAGGLVALFCFYAIRGYATPMLRDLLNRNCTSAVRATVLSIRSLLIRFGFALVGPAIGFGAGHLSLAAALSLFGLFLGIGSAAALHLLLRYHPEQEPPASPTR